MYIKTSWEQSLKYNQRKEKRGRTRKKGGGEQEGKGKGEKTRGGGGRGGAATAVAAAGRGGDGILRRRRRKYVEQKQQQQPAVSNEMELHIIGPLIFSQLHKQRPDYCLSFNIIYNFTGTIKEHIKGLKCQLISGECTANASAISYHCRAIHTTRLLCFRSPDTTNKVHTSNCTNTLSYVIFQSPLIPTILQLDTIFPLFSRTYYTSL